MDGMIRRFCGIFAGVLCVLLWTAVCAAAPLSVCFVCDGGGGDGSSAAEPLGSFSAALAALSDGGTLVVCGKTSVTGAVNSPAGDGALFLTSVYDGVDYRESAGASLTVSANINFYMPSQLDHLTPSGRPASISS